MAWIKAYKGFNKDMTCKGFQFEEGKEYELPEGVEAKLCQSGFHACEDPNDCFGYYEPGKSIFREVELDATDEKSEDSKRVGRRIRIGAELDVAKIVKAHFEYVNERCTPAGGRVGGDGEAVSVGNKASASAGFRGSASAGESGRIHHPPPNPDRKVWGFGFGKILFPLVCGLFMIEDYAIMIKRR